MPPRAHTDVHPAQSETHVVARIFGTCVPRTATSLELCQEQRFGGNNNRLRRGRTNWLQARIGASKESKHESALPTHGRRANTKAQCGFQNQPSAHRHICHDPTTKWTSRSTRRGPPACINTGSFVARSAPQTSKLPLLHASPHRPTRRLRRSSSFSILSPLMSIQSCVAICPESYYCPCTPEHSITFLA